MFKKVLFVLSFLVVCIYSTGCSNVAAKKQNMVDGKPYWFKNPTYKGKISGVGIGDTRDEARSRALDEIARQMKITIKSKIEVDEKVINDKYFKKVESSSIQTIEGETIRAYIKDVWEDKEKKEIYVWMVSYKTDEEYENLIKGDMTEAEIILQNDYSEKTASKIKKTGKEYGNTAVFKYKEDKNGIDESLTASLTNIGKLKLVDRKNIGEIIEEQKLSETGLVDEKTAVEVGKIAGAKNIITGEVNIKDIQIELKTGFFGEKEYRKTRLGINTKIIDSETGIINFSDNYYKEHKEVLKSERYRTFYYVPAITTGAAMFTAYYLGGYPERSSYKDEYGSTQSSAAYARWSKAKDDFTKESAIVGVVDVLLSLGLAELSYRIFR